MLERGRSLPEAVAEPALGFATVHNTVEGVASCGIRREQVAEAELGRGGICFEAQTDFRRGVVSSRGLARALLYARPIRS
jgi:hypothetical protein